MVLISRKFTSNSSLAKGYELITFFLVIGSICLHCMTATSSNKTVNLAQAHIKKKD